MSWIWKRSNGQHPPLPVSTGFSGMGSSGEQYAPLKKPKHGHGSRLICFRFVAWLQSLSIRQIWSLCAFLLVCFWIYLKLMWMVDTPYELSHSEDTAQRPGCRYMDPGSILTRQATFKAGELGMGVDGIFKPRIGVITFFNKMDPELMRASVQNKYQFVFEHGYELIIADQLLDKTRPAAWSKFKIMLKYLPDFDFLVWIDADALVANFSIKIEDFIDNNHDLWFSADENSINSGVFIVRRSPWSMWWLKECWDQTWLVSGSHPFKYEQRSIHYLFGTDAMEYDAQQHGKESHPKVAQVRERTMVLPPCVGFNSNVCEEFWWGLILYRRTPWPGMWCDNIYRAGDFVLHLAGKAPSFYRDWLVVEFHHMINLRYFEDIVVPKLASSRANG